MGVGVRLFLTVVLCIFLLTAVGYSAIITDTEFIPLYHAGSYATGSGLGTLDIVLFSGATAANTAAGLNYDDAYTDLPGGGSTADAYFITSFGDLRDFYTHNFIDNGAPLDEIMILVDLNESVATNVNFDLLDITVGNTDVYGDNRDFPNTTDIPSSSQNLTSTTTGGTLAAEYATDATFTTAKQTIENGSGWADYGIRTGIDPFDVAYSDTDRIVFHVQFSDLDNGAEEIFLSGEYSVADVLGEESPEPATILLLGLGSMFLLKRKTSK